MNVSVLLKAALTSSPGFRSDSAVQFLTSDSREVSSGALFVAISGTQSDGHSFLDAVFKAGAVAAIGEKPYTHDRYIQVKDSREALARLASAFYGHPSYQMKVLGVTGTSGKTTTTYLLESILNAAGYQTGLLGTVSFRYGKKTFPSTHTTPGPVELQKLLREMSDAGCTAVVMEVSSHALKQKRTLGIAFDGMAFTNLSREHLDFHPTMDDYFDSKALLFTDYAVEAVVAGKKPFFSINRDDQYGERLFQKTKAKQEFGFHLSDVENLQISLQGIRGTLSGLSFESPLVGKFNVENILNALVLARGVGIHNEAIQRGIRNLHSVPGRLDPVPEAENHGLKILVDYAHKPDALEKVLQILRELKPKGTGRLITVFGCGGDRDRTKRPVMGEIATRLSDLTIVTSDNPRTENPMAIITEILSGIPEKAVYSVEPDRRLAIHRSIEMAQKGDLILVAGKGHEDYQILGKQKIPFDDKKIALEGLTRVFKKL